MADQIQIDCPDDNDPVNTTFSVTGSVISSLAASKTRSKKSAGARTQTATTIYVRCVVWNPADGKNYSDGIQTTTTSWTYNFTTPLPTMSLGYLVAQLMDSPTEPAGVLSSDNGRISVVATGGVDCSSS